MTIIVDENTKVIIQGITGRTGQFATRYMLEYGTNVVGGVTPGRGGSKIWGVPVYDSVNELVDEHGEVDASVVLVPPATLKTAVVEAIDSGVKLLLIPTERVPIHDALYILTLAKKKNIRVVGPGSFGVINPGKAVLGWAGGSLELAREAFKPGRIGVISRSGGQTTTVSWSISSSGLGISTAIHVGAEPIVGTTEAELLIMFEEDKDTDAVVLFGEIGGIQEEEAAEIVINGKFSKPLVAFIAGRLLPSGIRYSHASAIIEGEKGSADSKIETLTNAGAYIVDDPVEIPTAVKKVLRR